MLIRPLILSAAVAVSSGVLAPTPAEASFKSCVAKIKRSAIKAGVSRAVAGKAFANIRQDEKVLRFSRSQPEYRTPIWDYMAFLVDQERIDTGRALLRTHGKTLRAVEKRYGVDRYVILALWGIESSYGRTTGEFFLPNALSNIACLGRKRKFFRNELIQALKLVTRGDLRMADLRGSWAGAFGQTQFLPSTYRRYAVDFDRDGRRDLVRSVPDALASAANYLRGAGWRKGQRWGFEVRMPESYRGPAGRKRRASLTRWSRRGFRKINGEALGGRATAGLIRPAGRNGPGFLVYRNFSALYSYNAAESYALAIGHLSDRLKGGKPFSRAWPTNDPGLSRAQRLGGKPFSRAWPTNDPGLSRAQRLELQKLLIRNGYDIGEADGKVGPVTRAAIRKAERRFGMKPTGRPGTKILKRLRGS